MKARGFFLPVLPFWYECLAAEGSSRRATIRFAAAVGESVGLVPSRSVGGLNSRSRVTFLCSLLDCSTLWTKVVACHLWCMYNTKLRCVEAKAAGVEALRASPDGRWLAVARSNGTLEIYEASTDFLKLVRKERSLAFLGGGMNLLFSE